MKFPAQHPAIGTAWPRSLRRSDRRGNKNNESVCVWIVNKNNESVCVWIVNKNNESVCVWIVNKNNESVCVWIVNKNSESVCVWIVNKNNESVCVWIVNKNNESVCVWIVNKNNESVCVWIVTRLWSLSFPDRQKTVRYTIVSSCLLPSSPFGLDSNSFWSVRGLSSPLAPLACQNSIQLSNIFFIPQGTGTSQLYPREKSEEWLPYFVLKTKHSNRAKRR